MFNQLKNHPSLIAYVFAITATAIWSGNFIIARGLNESISPIQLAFWRWTVAALAILPFAVKALIAERALIRQHIRYLSLTALLGITVFNTLIYYAGHTTTALNLSLISITFPIFIVLFSWLFFKDAITRNKGLGIGLVMAGVLLLITRGDLARLTAITFAIGDVWMLMAAITFALYSILVKRKPAGLSIWAFQLSTFLLGLIFLAPFFIGDLLSAPPAVYDGRTVSAILYIGLFASLTAFILWNKAIVIIGPARAGMIYYTLPIFSGVLAFVFLKESVSLVHLFSVVLIVSGILTANFESKKG